MKNYSKNVDLYLTLLDIGKAKSGEIVRSAKISGGKIYETLYKLVDKGLVKIIIENNVKYFIANKPETLVSYLNEQEKEIKNKKQDLVKLLPKLNEISEKNKFHENVSLIKGLRGISPIVYEQLKKGNEIMIMGVRSSKKIQYNNFWRNWHKERIKLKKEAKILFSDRNTKYWEFYKKLKLTKIKSISNLTPSAVMIIDNHSFIFSYEEEFTCIHIISKQTATSFRDFFNSIWKQAKQ